MAISKRFLERWPVIGLAAFGLLLVCFLFGGGSSAQVKSILIVRPAAAIALAVGLLTFRMSDFRANRFIILFLVAVIGLTIIHLLPLPPAVWASLPGRDIAVQTLAVADLQQPWRPISLVPFRTWNALFSLIVPAAAIVLTVQCSSREKMRLLYLILGIGGLACALSVLQVVLRDRIVFFYDMTNFGSAVGLFANRNHNAAFLACILPMFAVLAAIPDPEARAKRDLHRGLKGRHVIAIAGMLVVFPLILVAGSRAGLVLAVVAAISSCLIYESIVGVPGEPTRYRRSRLRVYGMAAVLILCAIGVFAYFSRAEALARFSALGQQGSIDERIDYWRPLPAIIWHYWPTGSGIGSFVEIFQVAEPLDTLTATYLNHAHNELLEIAVVAGLPGLLLIAVAIVAFVIAAYRLIRIGRTPDQDVALARLGLTIILIMALGSLVDYPLRTPALVALFAVAVVWTAGVTVNRRPRERAHPGVTWA